MYERLLDKQTQPSWEEMQKYCGEYAEAFAFLNKWLADAFQTEQKIVFPYGNRYGWGIAHKKKNKLICNIFAENGSFTVMLRLSDKQYQSVYEQLQTYARKYIDNKYSCGDGGWIHYRIANAEHLNDIQALLTVKCS